MPQPKFIRSLTAFYKTNGDFKHFLQEKTVLSIKGPVLERSWPWDLFHFPPSKIMVFLEVAGSHDALENLCLVILPGGVGINIDLELLLRGSSKKLLAVPLWMCSQKNLCFLWWKAFIRGKTDISMAKQKRQKTLETPNKPYIKSVILAPFVTLLIWLHHGKSNLHKTNSGLSSKHKISRAHLVGSLRDDLCGTMMGFKTPKNWGLVPVGQTVALGVHGPRKISGILGWRFTTLGMKCSQPHVFWRLH